MSGSLAGTPPMIRVKRCGVAMVLVLVSAPTTSAHVFLQPYTLPVPFWIYLYACAATLVLSFAVIGYFSGLPPTIPRYRTWDLLPPTRGAQSAWTWVLRGARAGALLCLLLTMTTGLFGTDDPRANINMTLF